MSDMARRERRTFTKEQKANAVAAYRECGNLSKVARDLDLHGCVLRSWVKQAEIDEGNGNSGDLTTDEKAELQRLKREKRLLQQEREFLKKAAAFFAKEDDQRTR